MIKDIRRIDLQGNEYLQEVVMCDRCKNILEQNDYYYTIKLISAHPVKMKPNTAYGLSPREPWHMCEECYCKLAKELNSDYNE